MRGLSPHTAPEGPVRRMRNMRPSLLLSATDWGASISLFDSTENWPFYQTLSVADGRHTPAIRVGLLGDRQVSERVCKLRIKESAALPASDVEFDASINGPPQSLRSCPGFALAITQVHFPHVRCHVSRYANQERDE